MNNSKIFLYIAGALFFAMCGSLWQEFVASDKSVNPSFRNSVNPSFRNSVNPSFRGSKARYYAVPKAAVESFEFDPNEADSSQLLRLGLTPAQVRSIYRHRARGYAYSRVEDFARTPFMTKGQWARLKPLIRIGDQYRLLNVTDNRSSIPDNRNTITDTRSSITDNRSSITDNRSPITDNRNTITDNRSSITDNRSSITDNRSSITDNRSSITDNRPPITDNRSSITDNRSSITDNRSPLPDNRSSITDNRSPLTVPTLHLNDDGFKTLLRHPFMSYEQVKAVKNFQRKYGRIRNMTELLILPEFTVEDTLRLSPYLQF